MVLYQGNYLNNDIKSKQLSLQASNLDIQSAENDITLQITQAFLNILLAKENIIYYKDLVATSQAQEAELWRLREDTDLIYRRYPAAPSFDVSVPLSQIEDYTARCLPELRSIEQSFDPYVFGHIADGNLHIVLNVAGADLTPEKLADVESVLYRGLTQSGGSFSAEHGIGSKRIHSLRETVDPVKFALMTQIKAAVDNDCTLNPGKVIG